MVLSSGHCSLPSQDSRKKGGQAFPGNFVQQRYEKDGRTDRVGMS